jgi:hypothetical protein
MVIIFSFLTIKGIMYKFNKITYSYIININ